MGEENANEVQKPVATAAKPLKITAVGDGMVGKTYSITVDGVTYSMTLWDTAGQEDYERLRPLSYPHTDCFLLCFSVGSTASYDNIVSKWCPELKHHCPNVPIVLVATKSDLREGKGNVISRSAGKKLKRKIGAARYLECSALKGEGLSEVFIEAVRAASKRRDQKARICVIL